MRTTIIVPFHRNLAQLRACVTAARRSFPTAELIVAADAAIEDCVPVVRAEGGTVVMVPARPGAAPGVGAGPAVARNRAAAAASGDILVFIDTDVVAAPQAVRGLSAVLEDDPAIAGVFGAYDHAPPAPNFMSQFKNLSHTYVHEVGNPQASTFWAGLGAVRAAAFREVGGFDERFERPSVEDIELGYRLVAAGHALRLDPRFRGTHLKRWTLWNCIVTDIRARGVPWTQLIHRTKALSNDLNTSHALRASVALAYGIIGSAMLVPVYPWAAVATAAMLGGLVALNSDYYRWLAAQRGVGFAARAVPAHLVHHLCNGISFVTGTVLHLAARLGVDLPGAIPAPPWSVSRVLQRCASRRVMIAAPPARPASSPLAGRILLAVALLIALLVGSRAITREGSFFLAGDPPRYLMDGVFLYDALASGTPWKLDEAMPFAERYYARYPALSLGHHPPLAPLSLVPFYAVFGVSVLSARLAMLTFFGIATVLFYRLVARIYDEPVAGWACLLFVTSPIIESFGQRVLSEMPTLALMMLTLTAIDRFRRSGRLLDYFFVIGSAVATLLCRPTAIYMFPAYAVFLLLDGGWARLTRGRVAVATLAGCVLFFIAVAAFLLLSPFNATVVFNVLSQGVEAETAEAVWAAVIREWPLFVAAAAGLAASLLSRDRRMWIAFVWALSVLGCALVLTGSIEPGRYTILAVPAYCAAAASLCAWPWARHQMALCALVLLTAAGWQLGYTVTRSTWEAPGYEAAAEYVLSQPGAPTVLYSASIDSGYFVFFVRKHDPAQHLVVLRSDKVLTTSLMSQLSVEDLIAEPEDIYPILQRYGTRFVVIEDRPSGSKPLDWLRAAVHTDRFIERRRFAIEDGDPALRGVPLVVYEYRDATAAAPDAELELNLPLAGRRIRVPLAELTTSAVR